MKLFTSIAASVLFSLLFSSNSIAQASETTLTVKVKGITCGNDLNMIATSVEKLEGVTDCEPGNQGTTTSFEINYDPALVSTKDLYAAIEGTGSCEDPDERPYKVKGKKPKSRK